MEWKQKNSIAGVGIYVISTVFLCYSAIQKIISVETYNALLWIIILFTGVNTVSKSFMQESDERQLYYYQLASPQSIILSKMLYNGLLMFLLSLVATLTYVLFLGNMVNNWGLFLTAIALGGTGFGIILSLVSAIASKSGNNPTIMAILSFPIIIPFLSTVIGLSANAIQGISVDQNLRFIMVLVSMDAIVIGLGYILFPYLWRD